MLHLSQILDTLESFHGGQAPHWPTDPYHFLVWWHCGYPPSEERCSAGWESLNSRMEVGPETLLSATSRKLAQALKAGGMVPELRAARLKQIAKTVREDFGADLRSHLQRLPLAKSRATLKKFPGIGDPGADRILLFGGIAPTPAVPSSCPHVLVRIESGREPAGYTATYRQAQQMLRAQVPDTFSALMRAYLLLQYHGRKLCKRTNPQCSLCPVANSCAFYAKAQSGRVSGKIPRTSA
jgi:endonuclease III